MTVVAIDLEACLPARNLARTYRVVVCRDLFGFWTVDLTFGRIKPYASPGPNWPEM